MVAMTSPGNAPGTRTSSIPSLRAQGFADFARIGQEAPYVAVCHGQIRYCDANNAYDWIFLRQLTDCRSSHSWRGSITERSTCQPRGEFDGCRGRSVGEVNPSL